jgi:hypothetical protein
MKKFAKMSLVAAVAVAGLNTTSSAAPLTEAIKNTDLSGYIRYRYTNGAENTESNEYKTVFTVKSKVNDVVTAKVKIAGAAATTDASGDADPDTTAVKEANFIMNLGGATVIAGKQALATPFADGADQQGTGIVAVKPMGAVTLAAGWYTNSDASSAYNGLIQQNAGGDAENENDIGGNNIAAVAAIGKAGVLDYALWYAQVSESPLTIHEDAVLASAAAAAGATAINLNLSAAVGPVNVELNHASVDYSLNDVAKTVANELNHTQTRVVVSGKAGPATVAVAYATTGEDGGNVTLGDTDAKANLVLEEVSASAIADASVMFASVSMPVGPVTASVAYVAASNDDPASAGTLNDATEMKVSLAYAMSKNFKISGFSTSGETTTGATTADLAMTRVEAKYSF